MSSDAASSELGEDEFPAVEPARLAAVFRERAQQYAARASATQKPRDLRPVLVIRLGEERMAIETSAVLEVLRYDRCSSLPGARPELLGLVNVRGRVSSVLDLATILEFPKQEAAPLGQIVLVRQGETQVGLKVDEAEQIVEVALAELTSSESVLAGAVRDLFVGGSPER